MVNTCRRGLRLLAGGLLVVLAALPSGGAPRGEAEAIRIGWVPLPALMEAGEGPDAPPTGFMIELARQIGERAGLAVTFHRYDAGGALLEDMRAGRLDMLAGVAALPVLAEDTLLSAPVGETPVRLFMRAETAEGFDPQSGPVRSFAVIGGLAGDEAAPLLRRHRLTAYESVSSAIGGLLLNRVQGIVGPQDTILRSLEAAGQEGPVVVTGPVLRRVSRVVSLRIGLTDLRPAIDDALDALEADGTLPQLRRRWGIAAPPQADAPLTVAMAHNPPYSIVHEDGTLSGFAVDVIFDLGQRAGIGLRFHPVTAADLAVWPDAGLADLAGLVPVSADAARMIVTRPLAEVPLVRIRRAEGVGTGAGPRLGTLPHYDDPALMAQLGAAETHVYPDGPALMAALRDGAIDAALYPEPSAPALLRAEGAASLVVDPVPVAAVAVGLALHPRLDQMRERLDAVIPAYLASPRYRQVQALWFAPPRILTPERVPLLIGTLCAVIAMLAGVMIWQDHRRSVVEARRNIAVDLIDSMPVGLLLIGGDGTVTYVNEEILAATPGGEDLMHRGVHYPLAMRRLVEAGVFDLEGRDPEEMLHLLAVEGLKDGFRHEFRMADGGTFVRTARRLSGGETLIVRQDVTEERARLRQIEGLNRALAEKVRLATATNEELRAFAYATSHDLKSPLNSAIMLADLLMEEQGEAGREEARDLVTDLRATLRGMAGLIDDVRLYTDAIISETPSAPCALQSIAEAVLAEMRPRLDAAGASVSVEGLPEVTGQPAQVRQLLSNLLENALKFRAPDRPLAIQLAGFEGEGEKGFRISDNGIGIDSAYHGRVFQLFQKLHPGTLYPGNGLGLPICQRIVLAHGGRIALSSAPDSGATFTVTFGKEDR